MDRAGQSRCSRHWTTDRLAVLTGEGDTKQLQGIEPPLLRLRTQDYRVFFRDRGDYLEISRVLDRKEAYLATPAL